MIFDSSFDKIYSQLLYFMFNRWNSINEKEIERKKQEVMKNDRIQSTWTKLALVVQLSGLKD